ncbi:hypothetical protein RFI_12293 [Reticulomyxa filosa]|uniref:Uncharacterized protein n=1 Tax=Reticulomyxa filosa TaxID=46433 RepID=X6NEY3_RETFI|nr:hypothetical protein RFI_12293 [Reticulomyxa filosa]|eukprot:ETO24865.1 hypothetical protein RFI_12293 [Reticulomyxa filosa]
MTVVRATHASFFVVVIRDNMKVVDLVPLELDVADLVMPSALRGREEDMELEEGLEGSSIAPEEMDWAIGTHLPIAEEKTEIDLDIPLEIPVPHPKSASEAETGLASKGEGDKGTVSASIPSVPELEQLPQIVPPQAIIREEVQIPTPVASASTPEEVEMEEKEAEVRRGVVVPKKKRKFGYDKFIEFEREEDQFIVNSEEWRDYLLPARPFKRNLQKKKKKKLGAVLFETPTSNRFGDRLQELLAESYRMELSGQLAERVSEEEKKRVEEVEFARGVGMMEMEEPAPFFMGPDAGLLAGHDLGLTEEEKSRVSEGLCAFFFSPFRITH